MIKHDKTPLWTQRCLTIEPPVWKIVNITSWWHPVCAKSQDHDLGPFLTLTQPPYAPAAFPRTQSPLPSLRRKEGVLWPYLVGGSMRKAKVCGVFDTLVSSKTKTDFKVLLPWSKKTSVRLSQIACATTTDQPYIVEQSTFSRPPTPSLYFESQFTLTGLKS